MQPATDPHTIYRQAETLLAAGDLRRTGELCKELLSAHPQFPYGYYLMSSLFTKTGDLNRALTFAQMASDKAPDIALFHIRLGQTLFALADWKAAAKAFQNACRLEPNNPLPVLLWADTCAQRKQFDRALELFARARAIADIPEIDEHEGLCLAMQGNREAAEKRFDRVIERRPAYEGGYIRKAKLLMDKKHLAGTESCLAKALACNPHSFEALHDMAFLKGQLAQPVDAIRYATQACQASPQQWNGYALMGSLLMNEAQYAAAEQVLEKANALNPGHISILELLFGALHQQQKYEQALPLLEKILAMKPGHPIFRHYRAMLQGENVENSPQEYITWLFDFFAERFDQQLVQGLSYKVPEQLASALRALPALQGRTAMSLLDLGCGTGLVAEALKDVTSLRVGVDLSEKMLEKARARQLYAELHAEDIVGFMQKSTRQFDLVTAADVLIYIGSLEPLFNAARRVLAEGGLLAFSIEKEAGQEPFRLNPTGRYSHTPEYVTALAAETGYALVLQQDVVLRMEQQVPAQGMIFIFKALPAH